MVTKNIKTDYSAVGNGIKVTRTISIAAGGNILDASTATWVPGDNGKKIGFQTNGDIHINDFLSWYGGTLTYVSATRVTIANALPATGAGPSMVNAPNKIIEWGTDDHQAFNDFVDAHQNQTGVILNMPAGRYVIAEGFFNSLGCGIKGLVVNGNSDSGSGTYVTDLAGSGNGLFLGSSPNGVQKNAVGQLALLNTVAAGSTTIVVKNSADLARFAINTWAVVTGWECMNTAGFPTANYYFDWVYITNITGSTVTIATPLRFAYKDTWIHFFPDTEGKDCGGPAAMFPVGQEWDCDHEYIDFNNDQMYIGGTQICGRKITLTRGNYENTYPTCSKDHIWNDINLLSAAEIDKLIDTITINGGTIRGMDFQTPNPRLMTMDGATVEHIMRAPKNLVATNCTFEIPISPSVKSFGMTESAYYEDCSIAGFEVLVPGDSNFLDPTNPQDGCWTYEGDGVFRRPIAQAGQASWASLGAYFTIGQFKHVIGQVLDQIVDPLDADYMLLLTTIQDGFENFIPEFTGFGAGQVPITVNAHPCADLTVINCTGSVMAESLSNLPPHTPFMSGWDYTYTGDLGSRGSNEVIPFFGRLISCTITVITPYTSGRLRFDPYITTYSDNDNLGNWDVSVDLTTVGVRHIVPKITTTPLGTDTGLDPEFDSVGIGLQPNQNVIWMSGVTGSGSVRFQLESDHGVIEVTQTHAVPLRLRLRAP